MSRSGAKASAKARAARKRVEADRFEDFVFFCRVVARGGKLVGDQMRGGPIPLGFLQGWMLGHVALAQLEEALAARARAQVFVAGSSAG